MRSYTTSWDTILLKSVQALRPAFGNPPPPPPVPVVEGKKPTDVYASLMRAGLALDSLDMPATAPNDVYRAALSALSDIELVRAHFNVTPVAPPEPAKGKKPKDAYDAAFALLQDLKALTEARPDLALPGGVVLPNPRTGTTAPGDVVDMIDVVQSELLALKARLGITRPTELAPPQAGKTPSDVFNAVQHGRATIAALRGAL